MLVYLHSWNQPNQAIINRSVALGITQIDVRRYRTESD